MKRQYTRRTDAPREKASVRTQSQPLSPELEELAQVLADYLRRANIKLTVVKTTQPAQPPETLSV